jgi:hypothetical protein
MARSLSSWLMDNIDDDKLKKQILSSLTTVCLSLFTAFYDSISYRTNVRPQRIAVARRAAAMESPSVPMLAASRFLSPPPLLPTPSCSRWNLSCVRAVPQTVEAPEAHKLKPPRPSPRRSAVAEVNASDDPVATLTRYSRAQFLCLPWTLTHHPVVFLSCIFTRMFACKWMLKRVACNGRITRVL